MTQDLKNTAIMTEGEPIRADKPTKASSWQNSTYWTRLIEFHADGVAYICCWIRLLLGVWMIVDIVLDVFQAIKYFSNNPYWYPSLMKVKQTKCKDTQNTNKGMLTIIFVVGLTPYGFDWTGRVFEKGICLVLSEIVRILPTLQATANSRLFGSIGCTSFLAYSVGFYRLLFLPLPFLSQNLGIKAGTNGFSSGSYE